MTIAITPTSTMTVILESAMSTAMLMQQSPAQQGHLTAF
jgi:hypothetical protein